MYRFNCGTNFWHAGRSKAEERFWVDHVHGDGSYKAPLRSRLSSRASSVATSFRPRTRNMSTQSDSSLASMTARSRNSSSGSSSDQVGRIIQRKDFNWRARLRHHLIS